MKNSEIEIKVKVEHGKPLLDFLTANGQFQKEQAQHDEYFSPTHRDFVSVRPVKEWLRLRSAQDTYSLNYKNWHHEEDGTSHFCDEYESVIGDRDALQKILEALNFKSLVVVDKVRKIWTYDKYEIAIDIVKGLGDFVEIEYKGELEEGKEPKHITEEMILFLKNLGCGTIERNYVGYPFQLLFGDEAKTETE